MRREGAPQAMRLDTLRPEARPTRQAPQDEECAGTREPSAFRIQKELRPVTLVQVRPAVCEVAAERVGGLAPDRNDPLLRSLADAADEPPLEVDGRPLEADGLARAQARAVEQLDERAIAQRARCRPGRGFDQPFRLTGRESPRERTPAAWQIELHSGVVRTRAEQHL